jgi:hypothetical protein
VLPVPSVVKTLGMRGAENAPVPSKRDGPTGVIDCVGLCVTLGVCDCEAVCVAVSDGVCVCEREPDEEGVSV